MPTSKPGPGRFGRSALLGLIDSLESTVRRLSWRPGGTEWDNYYAANNNYSAQAFEQKQNLVSSYLDRIAPETVWDLGANTGDFARLASRRAIPTIAFDLDPSCVERAYRTALEDGDRHLLPLCVDLFNPSPALGWEHRERMSLIDRGPADAVFALALIHHLAISGNVPLDRIAGFFAQVCRRWLVIEFVPKTDSQAVRLLSSREDIFENYQEESFRNAFDDSFEVVSADCLEGTDRTFYLLRRRDS